jgi:hypothetical protein
MTQNAGRSQGGVNKTSDKSADRQRRDESRIRDTEARTLDPGARTGGGAPPNIKGQRVAIS